MRSGIFCRHAICWQAIISLPLSTPVVADGGYMLANGSIAVHGSAESLKLGAAANLLRQRQAQGRSYVEDAGRSDSVTRLDSSAAPAVRAQPVSISAWWAFPAAPE
ncbi:hypothetical protein O0882_10730 [Janthinobacterium sp. SUN073]|uniref:hypothetical protein n=1 Tax=Janthinobacterium sp. SUN073 TaxID=3004102 RepID=UPI0025B06569|nr:hypothetical protein [Janthinobacterium sp. SUN073]MDN2696796.1 hypothetical protein [Janthinobacterium sp. SUN073]